MKQLCVVSRRELVQFSAKHCSLVLYSLVHYTVLHCISVKAVTLHYEVIPLQLRTLRNLLLSCRFSLFCQITCLKWDEMTASSLFFRINLHFMVKVMQEMALFHLLQSYSSCEDNLILIFLKNVTTNVFLTLQTGLHKRRQHFPAFLMRRRKRIQKYQQLPFMW